MEETIPFEIKICGIGTVSKPQPEQEEITEIEPTEENE